MVDFAKLLRDRRAATEREEEAAGEAQDRFEAGLTGGGMPEARVEPLHLSEPEDPHDWVGLGLAEPQHEEPTPATTPIPAVLDTDLNFISGQAGVGKTWMARALVSQRPGTLLMATTGIAATNLGEGTTINAALGYFDTASLQDSFVSGHLTARLGKLYRSGIRRLLIDEVSMMDGDQLTIITRALEELAGRKYTMNQALTDEVLRQQEEEGEDSTKVLPLKITLVADFCQLPPVKAAFAFESPEWERYAINTLKLTEIKRQSDRDFILALQAARRGDADTLCDYFGARLHQQHDPQFPGSTIYGTNEAVDRFNQLRLDKVPGKQVVVKSTRWGKQRGDWKNIPETLNLKEGALVMLLANQRDPLAPNPLRAKLIYANGDLAIITALTASGCYVKLQRNGKEEVVEWVTRDNQIPLEPGRLTELRETDREDLIGTDTSGKPRWERVGGVTYLPLRIAYATTCHKAQGLTLDHVQVDTKEGMFKTPGLLYVALSRARTSEGLRLIGSVDGLRQRCTVDRRVVPYL